MFDVLCLSRMHNFLLCSSTCHCQSSKVTVAQHWEEGKSAAIFTLNIYLSFIFTCSVLLKYCSNFFKDNISVWFYFFIFFLVGSRVRFISWPSTCFLSPLMWRLLKWTTASRCLWATAAPHWPTAEWSCSTSFPTTVSFLANMNIEINKLHCLSFLSEISFMFYSWQFIKRSWEYIYCHQEAEFVQNCCSKPLKKMYMYSASEKFTEAGSN